MADAPTDGGNLGQGRTPRARTAKQLERQARAFRLNVFDGKSHRQIAVELGVNKDTVTEDIHHEEQRLADENAARREHDKARATATYEHLLSRALKRATISDEILEQIRDGAECEKKVNDRSLEAAIKARERLDKLQGLEAPTKVDLAVQGLVEALTAIDDDDQLFPSKKIAGDITGPAATP